MSAFGGKVDTAYWVGALGVGRQKAECRLLTRLLPHAWTSRPKPDVHGCVRIGIDLSQLMALRKLGHLVHIQPGPQPARRHKAKTLRQPPPRNQEIGE